MFKVNADLNEKILQKEYRPNATSGMFAEKDSADYLVCGFRFWDPGGHYPYDSSMWLFLAYLAKADSLANFSGTWNNDSGEYENTSGDSWQRVYKGAGDYTNLHSIEKTYTSEGTHNGYLAVGTTAYNEVYVVKTNLAGETAGAWDPDTSEWVYNETDKWQRTYGQGRAYFVKGTRDADGNRDGYVMTGHYCTVKIDLYGNLEWRKEFGGNTVQQTVDDGYIISGYDQTSPVNRFIYLIKLDSDGDTAWQQHYTGYYQEDGCCSVQECADGGYIVVGGNCLGTEGGHVIFKTDANGNCPELSEPEIITLYP
jgi:hypothetical protein